MESFLLPSREYHEYFKIYAETHTWLCNKCQCLAPSSGLKWSWVSNNPGFDELRQSILVAVQSLSRVWLLATPWTTARQVSLSFTLSWRFKLMSVESPDAIRPSHPLSTPFYSCLQSFPVSESFPMSLPFGSGGQNTGASTSASVPPMNIQDWFPLGWTGWISLQSKGLPRVFSSTTVQKHRFFCAQPSLWFSSHIYRWPLEKP